MKDRAQIVIIGAGISGASIAYHLARLCCRDVVVLDAGPLVGGTTSHAPGLVGQLRSSVSLTRMLMYSVELYRTLALDGTPGYAEVGSLRLASTPERLDELKRQAGFAAGIGLEAHLLGPGEALALFPVMDVGDVLGALYLPGDGSALATILASAMIQDAMGRGIEFHASTPVTGIEVSGGSVRAVQTVAGRIETETVVVAAGIWSPVIARMAGVDLPLVPMEHQYIQTEPIPAMGQTRLPNLRDPDNLIYFRQRDGGIVIGGYERTPLQHPIAGTPDGPQPTVLPFDTTRFEPLYDAAVTRMPAIDALRIDRAVNGLEAFTADGEFLLGPVAGLRGFWAACGFCAHGVSGAGGVGRVMAEWIGTGAPSLDLWHMDVRRVGSHAAGSRYVRDRASEVYGTYYDILYPFHERRSMRDLRLSPMHDDLAALGARFGEKAGWERPNWFDPNAEYAVGSHMPGGWPARNWSAAIEAEHRATRERAVLFDVTSFSKLEIGGPGALALLQWLTDNEMDRPAGSIIYTQMLNEAGGIECDLTVTRLAEDRFMLVTGAAFGTHDLSWIGQHLPDDGSVYARDITSSRCCVGLWGPRARDILQSACEEDVSNEQFPYLTAREIHIGAIPVLALRVTYVGELGWELYAPMEYGRALWRTLWEVGREHGALPAGYRAIESLRLEKGYRYWSADIHSEYTPYEAGLGFAVRLDKGQFLGREALVAQKEYGIKRKLCCLVLADPSVEVLGGEPIVCENRQVGRVTSGGYGYTVQKSIAYGYLERDIAIPGTVLDVTWFGERIGAVVAREPLYDPSNSRVKEVAVTAARV